MVVLRALSAHVCPTAAAVLFVAASANAQPHGQVQALVGVRVTESPRVDGRLDDAAWREVKPATEFTQRDPNEGQAATERTELRIVYDASAVYVAFACSIASRTRSSGGSLAETTPLTRIASASTSIHITTI